MLEDLNRIGYSDSRTERAFDLVEGTISFWKQRKNIYSEELALIRLIYAIPSLIDVAESGYKFDPIITRQGLLVNKEVI